MTYSIEEIRRRLRLGEDGGWEFKEVRFSGDRPIGPKRDTWADEIAAFANTDGGVLLCGITDAGDVQRMSRVQLDELERLIVEVCSDSIQPPIRPGVFREEARAGHNILLVTVSEGHSQHDSPGGSFVRVGSAKRKMSSDERLRLAQRRGQSRFLWFDEQPVEGTGIGTLEKDLWKPLISAEGAADPELALKKLGLLAEDLNGTVRATVAGVLLCCGNPQDWLPNACISATCYRGLDKASGQLDAQVIGGPLDNQIRKALAFAMRNMRVAARKDPARQDLPQYSEKALFEAVVNAVVHRDYSVRGSRIRLSMFQDRLELSSPGGLPNNLSVDSIGDRQATRNEVLTSVFSRMNVGATTGGVGRRYFMERRGDGVPIIQRETQELSGSLPVFRLIDEAELFLTVPAASLEFTEATAVITVRGSGKPLAGADVLALFPNRTWKHGVSDSNGEVSLNLHSIHLPMVVFAGAPGFAAGLETDWVPEQRPLAIELRPLPGGGSVIFPESTGRLPILTGRLNPILDDIGRTYLYASNIAINFGMQQPVSFFAGENLHLADANGRETTVRIVNVAGRSALLEYGPISKEGADTA